MKAYKYRAIEFFERDLESLIKNQIYAPPFIELNDPFEGIFNDEITQFIDVLSRIFKVDTSDVTNNLEDIKGFKSKLGIYSLSTKNNEELLWAHYASSHKGFCIEYDTEKLKDKYLATVNEIDVDYNQSPQSITIDDIGNRIVLFKKLFATKSLAWEKENEIRLIFDTSSFKNYHPSALTCIYFGQSLTLENREKLINSLVNRDIRFYEIIRNKDSYQLNRRFVCENKRKLIKKLDENSYKILKTNHQPLVENFFVLYKSKSLDQSTLKEFFEAFRERYATKDCNIDLFDDESVLPLFYKYPMKKNEYIKLADHYIAMSPSGTLPEDFNFYPYQDFKYKEYGGKNWKNNN